MRITQLDHLVLTVKDINASCRFYQDILGMDVVTFGEGRKALHFGQQKINLHPAEVPYRPHASRPVPGSADLCFITDIPLDAVLEHLNSVSVPVEEGPVARTGAVGPLMSIYFRDPDGNLLEIANQIK